MDINLLLKIIQKHKPKDQSELLDLLQADGSQATQSTLSRQLKRLGIAKVNGVYETTTLKPSLQKSSILNIKLSPPNLLLIKTLPAMPMLLLLN